MGRHRWVGRGAVAVAVVVASAAAWCAAALPAAATPVGYARDEAADLHRAAASLDLDPGGMHTTGAAVVRFLVAVGGRDGRDECGLRLARSVPGGDTGPYLMNADLGHEAVRWVAAHYCVTPVQAARLSGAVLTFLAGVGAAQAGRPYPPVEPPDPSTVAVVLAAVDGDTLRVRTTGGAEERLRLVGIDAPETGECTADRATAALAALTGTAVRLETDVDDRDGFGRLLRYVWSERILVNELLAGWGLAIARPYPPDTRYQARIDAAGRAAQAARVGLWDPAACGPASGAALVVERINADAPGDDGQNLNGEWVVIRNTGATAVDLTGWGLRDESASHRYRFPAGFVLGAGQAVTVYSGCGTDGGGALHWCSRGSAVWNNSGDTAFLLDPNGNVVTSRSY